jgi:hypothetical protein
VLKPWLTRIVKILIIAQISYLVLINIALNLPLTQTLLNRIDPEIFVVTWERAWSPYPFRVHAYNVLTNGQASSLQWQVTGSKASASIALFSLFLRTVSLSNVVAHDVAYYQRPLPTPDDEYKSIRKWFPPVQDRVLEPAATEVIEGEEESSSSSDWQISITDIKALGSHELWFYQVLTKLEGELQTDLSFNTEGPFSLGNGSVDIIIKSMTLNGDREVIRDGSVKGAVELLSFDTNTVEGPDILGLLNIDAGLHVETESLTFFNIYLNDFEGMALDGTGLVEGRLYLQKGELLPGTDINVSAHKLSLDIFDKHLQGDGHVSLKAADDKEATTVQILFNSIEATDTRRNDVLFHGNGVSITAQASRSIMLGSNKRFKEKQLLLTIPEVAVPDLAVYQTYIPKKLPLHLYGGEGRLQGFAELTRTGLKSNLQLDSTSADVGFKKYRFRSNLDALLKMDSPQIASGIDVSGTYVHLQGAQLSTDEQQRSKPLDAAVDIVQGSINLLLPEGVSNDSSFQELYQGIKDQDILGMLDSGKEDVQITASISDLTWLSMLLDNSYGLAITGAGEVDINIFLSKGWLGKGTKLTIEPQTLGVEVLDYAVEGDGEVTLLVDKGGERPDMLLDIMLDNALMRRKDEQQAFIEDVSISLQALAKNITIDDQPTEMDLHLKIPTATVRDMSVYNQYMPADSPMQFTGGKAELSSDIRMTPKSAKGYVKLGTTGLSATVDQQEVEGELTADITLIDGIPENMDFDISGSSITLDNVKVTGTEVSHDDEEWSAQFDLRKGHANWKKPIDLHLEADLQMTNSKPIVAIIANQRGKNGWLEKALTIDDVAGEANINVSHGNIIIPYAFVGSDKIDVGAKGVITADERNGVYYVRFRKLDAVLKMNNGNRNLDVWNARKTFDKYDSELVLLKMSTEDVPDTVKTNSGEWQE